MLNKRVNYFELSIFCVLLVLCCVFWFVIFDLLALCCCCCLPELTVHFWVLLKNRFFHLQQLGLLLLRATIGRTNKLSKKKTKASQISLSIPNNNKVLLVHPQQQQQQRFNPQPFQLKQYVSPPIPIMQSKPLSFLLYWF